MEVSEGEKCIEGNQRETAPGLFLPLSINNTPRPVWRCRRNPGSGCPTINKVVMPMKEKALRKD